MSDLPYRTTVPLPDRREALKLGIGLAASAVAVAAMPAQAAPPQLDPANPHDARQIYRKLRYRTDSGLVFSWIKGPYMAAVAGDLVPIYAINLGSIQRITHNPDGSFDLIDLEISFRVDLRSGERLTHLRNPVTGEMVRVGGRGPIPTHLKVSADNEVVIPDLPGQPRYEHTHAPVTTFALRRGELAIRDLSHARVTAPDGSVSYLNEVSTISAPRDQVLDPRTTNLETRVQSNDVRSWPAWMNMGDRPGTLALLGNGGKVSTFADLPDDWHAMLQAYYPEIAADPVAVLDGKVKVTGAA
jgi:hypothetical protein